MKFLLILLISNVAVAGSSRVDLPLETVPRVEIDRYLGKWYDIAHLPQKFQKGCSETSATYSMREDGDIDVLNYCVKPDGEDVAHGKAWVVDPVTNAKLKVQFFWPFRGNYWILELGTNYEYAVVGEPSRKYLWVLSRSQSMDSNHLKEILDRQGARGFPVEKVEMTPHTR